MKHLFPTRLLLSFVALTVASSTLVHAQYTNGQNANILWGQGNFVTSTPGAGVGKFNKPTDFAIDPTSGKFFVADSTNNRVLRFSSSAAFTSGAGAEAVFGQKNFTDSTAITPVDKTALKLPNAIVIDSQGTLWVTDTGNNRVVGFLNASTIGAGTGAAASANLILGQVDFSGSAAATTQSGMKTPTGVMVDGKGALYVVDQGNNRVLKYANPYATGNGIAAINATGQFGQTNYLVGTANFPTISASTFNSPTFAKLDGRGNMWVSDTLNNRVLCFTSVATQPDSGAVASSVLGQPGFITTGVDNPTTQHGFSGPLGVTFDILDRVYIADGNQNRIMVWETITTGAAASFVLGQPTFNDGNPTTTQTGVSKPTGMTFSNLQLWVADQNNNRVINFTLSPGTPSIVVPAIGKLSTTKKKSVFTFYIANTSVNSDIFTAGVSIPSATKKRATLSFTYAGQDVTSALLSNTFTTPLFRSNLLAITVTAKPKTLAKKQGGTIAFTATATSATTSSRTASGSISVKYKKPKKK